jgi:predicted HTH transcriptional regulator
MDRWIFGVLEPNNPVLSCEHMTVDVQQLLISGESEAVEFKQSRGEMKEIIETIGAFANGEGGTIVIGVTPAGRVLGVNIGKDTLESLANGIQQQTDPKVFPSIDLAVVEDRTVIVWRVETSQSKPVLVQGRGYKRVGRNNHVLSSSELVRVLSTSWETSWDAGLMFNATIDDIEAEALREAIINATCHRDYRDSGNVQVHIFDDRLEVWSTGLLPEGIAIADLYRTHSSRPRNHRLAHAYFLISFIEQWGTGTLRMVDLCRKAGIPDPQYAEISGAFVVTFRKAKATKKYHEGPEQIVRQKQAREYVRQQGRITTQDYTKFLGVSTRTARRDLAVLVEKGVFRQVGKGRAGYFELA